MNPFRKIADRRDAAAPRKQARRLLALEPLEGRVVLSTVTYGVTNLNDSGAGSLRQAIISADAMTTPNSPVTIAFNASLAHKTITPSTALPLLKNSVNPISLAGVAAPGLKLSLANSFKADSADPAAVVNTSKSGLYVAAGSNVTVANLEIANASGRAFENHGTLALSADTVDYSANGAAVNYGTMSIGYSDLTHNTALRYGGAVNNFGGSLTIASSTIEHNNASVEGGGIASTGGTVNVSGTTFQSNYGNPNQTFDEMGGALYLEGGATATVTGSSFTGNVAAVGGAIHNNGGNLSVSSSTFTNNFAYYGGAIDDNGASQTVLDHDTFTANTAYSSGGAIYVDGSRPVKLTHSDLYDNSSPHGSNVYGALASTSLDDLIGSGDGLTGVSDRPTGASPIYIGSNPLDQIRPIMTKTATLNDGHNSLTYTYTYDVRHNTGSLKLDAPSSNPERITVATTYLDLHDSGHEGQGNGVGPFNEIHFEDNEGTLGGLSISLNYDAPTASKTSLPATPTVSVELHTGKYVNAMGSADIPSTRITVDSGATLSPGLDPNPSKKK